MEAKEISVNLLKAFEQQGYRGEMVSVDHLEDLINDINPSWHHCLVGCMICQKVCPVDKQFCKWVVEGSGFTAGETACLRQGATRDDLDTEILKKLDQLSMTEYLDILGRNLQALIGKQAF